MEHQADAAHELRTDLDRLRRQLDDGPPPLTPVHKRSRKPLIVVLAIGGVIGTAILVPWADLNRSSPTRVSSSAGPADSHTNAEARKNAEAGNDGEAGEGPGQPGTAPAPRLAPAGSMPASGPGIDRPGTMMLVRITTNDALEVIEKVRFAPESLPEIALQLPSMASLGGQVADLTPTVQDLRMAVNGTPVTTRPTDGGRGWAVTLTGTEPARAAQLSYRIQGAIIHSNPSSSGRALGVSLPLLGQTLREQGLPLVVRTQGTVVVGATCPTAPTAKMLCGTEISDGWMATVPAEATSPAVLLQLNLR